MEPVVFHSVVATATTLARVTIAFFAEADLASEPTCVALLECSAEAAKALAAALSSAGQAIEETSDA